MGRAGGAFLTFEGIDGAGKSTQVRALAAYLREAGRSVVQTREPGGSEGAEAIRALLVSGEEARWSPETELLLFTAARRDHLEKTILPGLAEGAVVLCDRYVDSTRAYQGMTDPALGERLETLHRLMIGRDADLTLLLDLDPDRAVSRIAARAEEGPDRFDGRGAVFQRTLRARFLTLAAAEPDRFRVIDAAAPAESVARDVREAVDAWLSAR